MYLLNYNITTATTSFSGIYPEFEEGRGAVITKFSYVRR